MTGAPTFSIVVPTFRRPEALRATLTRLLALDYPRDRYEVIVVDDAGESDVAGCIADAFGRLGVSMTFRTQHRRGAASARNQGARVAGGELVLFCDDDILVEPSHLRAHAAAHARHPHAAVNGTWEFPPGMMAALRSTPFGRFRIELERGFQREAGGAPLDGDPGCLRMPLLTACNLSLRRELFWEIGGFDEDFPLAGAEDQDLSLRAKAANASLLLDTKIRCLHNDDRASLRAYCAREERGASTVAVLARKYPAVYADVPFVRENRSIDARDSPGLVAKKLVKAMLAAPPVLAGLHALVPSCEAVHMPDRILRRLYLVLLGLHLYRGFRRSWSG